MGEQVSLLLGAEDALEPTQDGWKCEPIDERPKLIDRLLSRRADGPPVSGIRYLLRAGYNTLAL